MYSRGCLFFVFLQEAHKKISHQNPQPIKYKIFNHFLMTVQIWKPSKMQLNLTIAQKHAWIILAPAPSGPYYF